jgi:hypothetical protein
LKNLVLVLPWYHFTCFDKLLTFSLKQSKCPSTSLGLTFGFKKKFSKFLSEFFLFFLISHSMPQGNLAKAGDESDFLKKSNS